MSNKTTTAKPSIEEILNRVIGSHGNEFNRIRNELSELNHTVKQKQAAAKDIRQRLDECEQGVSAGAENLRAIKQKLAAAIDQSSVNEALSEKIKAEGELESAQLLVGNLRRLLNGEELAIKEFTVEMTNKSKACWAAVSRALLASLDDELRVVLDLAWAAQSLDCYIPTLEWMRMQMLVQDPSEAWHDELKAKLQASIQF